MKRTLLGFLLLVGSLASATTFTWTLTNNGVPAKNPSLTFVLQGCPIGVPIFRLDTQQAPVSAFSVSGLSNSSTGTISGSGAGNDLISCGGLINSTSYIVSAYDGQTLLWTKIYRLQGSGPVDMTNVPDLGSTTGPAFLVMNPVSSQTVLQPMGTSLLFQGVVQFANSNTPPNCTSSLRGSLWVTSGVNGQSDTVQMCLKGSNDTWAWRTIYAAP